MVDVNSCLSMSNLSTAPALVAIETEDTDAQLLTAIDRKIRIYLKTHDYLSALLILLSVYYTFNLAYVNEHATLFK